MYLADILVLCYNPPGKMCNTHFPIKATWTWVLAGFRLIKCCFSFLCVYFCKQCLLFILQIIKRNLNNQNQTKPIHRNREELHNYATGLSRILFGQHACLSRVVEIQRHSPACRMLIVLKKKVSDWIENISCRVSLSPNLGSITNYLVVWSKCFDLSKPFPHL